MNRERRIEKLVERVKLGRTDLEVARIGIGGGSAISSPDLEYAIESGINYIFTSCDFHAYAYLQSAQAIRKYCSRGSASRDRVVLNACSYVNDPEKLLGVLTDQMITLGVDHVDIFQWGWVTREQRAANLLDAAHDQFREADGVSALNAWRTARDVADEMRCRGYARYLAISTHERLLARELMDHPNLDAMMIRYNIAHRGAENELLPHLRTMGDKRPGVVTFNTTHNGIGSLTNPPPGHREGDYLPTHGDLYRFSLRRPEIDVVLSGVRNREEVDAVLAVLEKPEIDEEVVQHLNRLGHLHYGRQT